LKAETGRALLCRRFPEHDAPDPLANAVPGILAHLNADHVDAMILLARVLRRSKQPRQPYFNESLGFSLKLLKTKGGPRALVSSFCASLPRHRTLEQRF
jgi:hypothetical protein